MNKRLTKQNEGQKKPPHHVGEDRDGVVLKHITNCIYCIFTVFSVHKTSTSTTSPGFTSGLSFCTKKPAVWLVFSPEIIGHIAHVST